MLKNNNTFKILLLLLVVGCLGLPINTLWHFILLIAVIVAIVAMPAATFTPRQAAIMFATLATALILNHILPRASIEEGYNLFLPEGERSNIAPNALPHVVYARAKQEFDQAYPPDKRCDPQSPGCWLSWNVNIAKPAKAAYAQSMDDIFSTAKYSRVVNKIDFSNLEELRAGFVNDIYYHWWNSGKWDSDIKRSSMPYFVMYEMNERLTDSQMCWKGELLWEQEPGNFNQIVHDSFVCKPITLADNGKHIYGLSINPAHPLTMQFQPNFSLRLFDIIREAFVLLSITVVLALSLQWNAWQRILLPSAFIGATALFAVVHVPEMFSDYRILVGGDDGLTHEGYGREILRHFLAGDIVGALRGEEDIYFFMPGMRYFRAMGLAIFGETNYGYLATILVLPLIAYGVARLLLPRAWSFAILILGSVFFFKCMGLSSSGYADPMGYALFLSAMWLILNPESGMRTRWVGHFILALAIFVRPNLSFAALILITLQFWEITRTSSVRTALLSSSGFGIVLLIPIHNYIYGHRFVPLTAAANIPENLKVPPLTYINAIRDAISGNLPSASMDMVLAHLYKFSNSWLLLLLVLVLSAWVNLKRIQARKANELLLITMGLFLPFFFYDASYRYSLLAWLCAIIIGASYVYLLRGVTQILRGREA